MNRSIVSCFALVLTASLVALTSWAEEPQKPFKALGKPTVSFEATGPAGLSIKGSTRLTLADGGEKLTFVVPTKELKTGIGLRDDHLQKHIKAKEFPEAKLVIPRNKVPLPADDAKGKSSRKVQAELTFHGVTKPVQVAYTIEKVAAGHHVEAELVLVLTDFGVEEPGYLGVKVKKDVRVAVNVTVARE